MRRRGSVCVSIVLVLLIGIVLTPGCRGGNADQPHGEEAEVSNAEPTPVELRQPVVKDKEDSNVKGIQRADDERLEVGKSLTVTGELQTGLMAIGGETSGLRFSFQLEGDDKQRQMELDPGDHRELREYGGKRLKIKGTVVMKRYVERGPVRLLKVEEFEVAE